MQNPSPSPPNLLISCCENFSWAAVNVLFCHVMLQVTLTKPDSDSTNLWVDLSTRMASLTSIRVMCSAATERPGSKRVAPTSSSWKEPHSARGCRAMRPKRDRRWSHENHETLLEMLAASNLLKCQAWNDFTKTGLTLKQGIPMWRLRTEIRATYMLLIVTSVLTKKTQSVSKRVVVFAGNMCTTWSELHWNCVAFARHTRLSKMRFLTCNVGLQLESWELATQTSKLKNDCREQATWHLIFIFGAIIQIHAKLIRIKAIVVCT